MQVVQGLEAAVRHTWCCQVARNCARRHAESTDALSDWVSASAPVPWIDRDDAHADARGVRSDWLTGPAAVSGEARLAATDEAVDGQFEPERRVGIADPEWGGIEGGDAG